MDIYSRVGQLIMEFRKIQGISRKELSKDICHPSYISRLEKGERCPNVIILKELANRLKIPISYFFEILENDEASELNFLRKEIYVLHSKGDYSNMIKKISKSTNKFNLNTIADYQFFQISRVKALAIVNKEYDIGIDRLKKMVDEFVVFKSLLNLDEFIIMASIGELYIYKRDFENAMKSYKMLYKLKNNVNYRMNFDNYGKFGVMYALLSLLKNELNIAKLVIEEAFILSKKYNSSPVLCQLYLLKGAIYSIEGNEKLSKDCLYKSNMLYDLLCPNNYDYKLIESILNEELNVSCHVN